MTVHHNRLDFKRMSWIEILNLSGIIFNWQYNRGFITFYMFYSFSFAVSRLFFCLPVSIQNREGILRKIPAKPGFTFWVWTFTKSSRSPRVCSCAKPNACMTYSKRFQLPRWRVVSMSILGRKIDFVANCIAECLCIFFHFLTQFNFYNDYWT